MGSIAKYDFYNNVELSDEDYKYFKEQEKIGNIIIDLIARRDELGMTQRDLEKKSGVKQTMIARIEKFDSIPRLDTLIRLADALDMELCLKKKH